MPTGVDITKIVDSSGVDHKINAALTNGIPFGPIVYNSTNGTVQDGAALPKATLWQQYAVTIGYSFNEPNGAMTFPAPVYLKCTPQSNGSAVMVGLVQSLPSANDGYIYIFLGRAYSATAMELTIEHPVFYHDGTAIRLWTGAEGQAPLIGSTANNNVWEPGVYGWEGA